MREIALFVEDHAHHEVLKALIGRLAREHGIEVKLDPRNVRRGHGAVIRELKQYLRDLYRGRGTYPDLVVVATDANCGGLNSRLREITEVTQMVPARVVCAIPDPHIERWLLVDSSAFKSVFGRGCTAPGQKCERARAEEFQAAGAQDFLARKAAAEFFEDFGVAQESVERAERLAVLALPLGRKTRQGRLGRPALHGCAGAGRVAGHKGVEDRQVLVGPLRLAGSPERVHGGGE